MSRWVYLVQAASRRCRTLAQFDLYHVAHASTATAISRHHQSEFIPWAMQAGMLMDATLQALLRGNARMGVGGDCGRMEAVIPQTKQTGLSKQDYRWIFPEVNLVDDLVLMPPKPLKGRLKELDAIVVRRLEAGETEMTSASLREEMGMSDRNFRALVQKQEWQARRAQLDPAATRREDDGAASGGVAASDRGPYRGEPQGHCRSLHSPWQSKKRAAETDAPPPLPVRRPSLRS